MSLLRWVPHRGTLPALPPLEQVEGTPVMLLHGLMGSPGNFEGTVHGLLDLGVPVVAPLYGRRGTVRIEQSFAELMEVTGELLAERERIDIVGHSLGGHLGLRLAHEFPGRVRTLVGLGAAFRGLPLPPNPVVRHGVSIVMGRGAGDLMTSVPFEAVVPEGTRVVSLISDTDWFVPAASSEIGEVRRLRGTRHEHLPGLAGDIITALEWKP
ncbi:alpha/beta fold hydrolase [Corynebacterium hylobatis]|uniref:Alpha/beta fold hydrolase n=1 Tax=Corynebacterium hylobatis TaxID=1859290 RepID=A0A430HVY7_9CORY|nr:alpha/beta fold hydrolase [Corynebacterium hylobatis]RSZ61587.1 alpha/beta fold hydrolase [Corynebacterium hylobatis]